MILTDTGPLVALVDRNDVHHQACTKLSVSLTPPMVTTWVCFTEAMYLLDRAGGHPAQEALWDYIALGALVLRASDEAEQTRMRALMATYRDTPMDLADASLIAAADVLGAPRIFSVDGDFYIYRLADGRVLEVVPGPQPQSPTRRR